MQASDDSDISKCLNLEVTLSIPRNVRVQASTSGGHVSANHLSNDQNFKTMGGHIDISELTSSVDAKTSGGNIMATMIEADGPLTLSTSADKVKLLIPEQTPDDLDITNTSVKLDNAYNLDGTSSKGNIKDTINGGGIPIVINCGYGNVNCSP